MSLFMCLPVTYPSDYYSVFSFIKDGFFCTFCLARTGLASQRLRMMILVERALCPLHAAGRWGRGPVQPIILCLFLLEKNIEMNI